MKTWLLVLVSLNLYSAMSWSQSTNIKWRKSNYNVYCGEYTYRDDFIRDVDDNECRRVSPTEVKWRNSNNFVYCGEYTSDGWFIRDVQDVNCREKYPPYIDWRKSNYSIYCSEYTPQGWHIRDIEEAVCRESLNGGRRNQYGKPIPKVDINQLNQSLQPSQGAQLFIAADVQVPRNKGCGASVEARGEVQCYVCQAETSRNSMLYTKESILGFGQVQMNADFTELRIQLIDSDDLGSIRCLPKNKGIVNVKSFDEMVKLLEESGIKFKDAGLVVRRIGQPAQNNSSGAVTP